MLGIDSLDIQDETHDFIVAYATQSLLAYIVVGVAFITYITQDALQLRLRTVISHVHVYACICMHALYVLSCAMSCYDMVWYGMVLWDGMVWHGMAWDWMGWVVWDGMGWDGMMCMCMCMCMRVCVCVVCIACVYARMCLHLRMYVCTHVCMYVCMHVIVCQCMHVCVNACMYARTQACLHACMQVRMRVCMRAGTTVPTHARCYVLASVLGHGLREVAGVLRRRSETDFCYYCYDY